MVTVPLLPESLVGRTIGFLDNRKANFDRLADEIGGILRAEHGVKAVIHREDSTEPVDSVSVSIKRTVLAELHENLGRLLARSTGVKRRSS